MTFVSSSITMTTMDISIAEAEYKPLNPILRILIFQDLWETCQVYGLHILDFIPGSVRVPIVLSLLVFGTSRYTDIRIFKFTIKNMVSVWVMQCWSHILRKIIDGCHLQCSRDIIIMSSHMSCMGIDITMVLCLLDLQYGTSIFVCV